jgi:hypothetical protein
MRKSCQSEADSVDWSFMVTMDARAASTGSDVSGTSSKAAMEARASGGGI